MKDRFDFIGHLLLVLWIVVVLGLALALFFDDTERTKTCKDAGGVRVRTSRGYECLQVSALPEQSK